MGFPAGEMAQQLREFAGLAEDQSSGPSPPVRRFKLSVIPALGELTHFLASKDNTIHLHTHP